VRCDRTNAEQLKKRNGNNSERLYLLDHGRGKSYGTAVASQAMNDRIRALRAQQAQALNELLTQQRAEQTAVRMVAGAAAAVAEAKERRAAGLAKLDAAVAGAEREHDVAVAVLAVLLGDDDTAASVVGVELAAVRAARRRASRELVDASVEWVREGRVRRRAAGRAGGAVATPVEPAGPGGSADGESGSPYLV
jgi:hypothetical protein